MAWFSRHRLTILALTTVTVFLLGVSSWAKLGTSRDVGGAKRLSHCGQPSLIYTLINVTCNEVSVVAKNVTSKGTTAVSFATYRSQSSLSGSWQCHASAGGEILRCANDTRRFKRMMVDHDPNREDGREP